MIKQHAKSNQRACHTCDAASSAASAVLKNRGMPLPPALPSHGVLYGRHATFMGSWSHIHLPSHAVALSSHVCWMSSCSSPYASTKQPSSVSISSLLRVHRMAKPAAGAAAGTVAAAGAGRGLAASCCFLFRVALMASAAKPAQDRAAVLLISWDGQDGVASGV